MIPVLGVILLVLMFSFTSAGSGSVWTTLNDCGTEQQDVNHYLAGDDVYINGNNFNSGNYDWDIKGLPGQASCDPASVVASGNVNVNSSGAFCFNAYTVLGDDCGEYKASVGNKHDNYRVDETPLVPEFTLVIGIITIFGALIAFFVIRKN